MKARSKSLSLIEPEKLQRRFSADDMLINNTNAHQPIKESMSLASVSKKFLVLSSILGIGSGMAMMPIFNHEIRSLEDYGINIHSSKIAFIISTFNTLFVVGASSTLSLYHFFRNSHDDIGLSDTQVKALKLSKIGAIITSILPVSLLWNIELHDQKVSDSQGFDQFVAWATFATIPLMIFKTIETYEGLRDVTKGTHNIKLDSIGSKLITYGTAILSIVARSISFTAATEELAINMGFGEDASRVLGILIGGFLGASASTINEYASVKSLCSKTENTYSKKDILTGVLSVVEGMWFALPTISCGLNAVKEWNPILKAVAFVPFFFSKATYEATNLYNSFKCQHAENLPLEEGLPLEENSLTGHSIIFDPEYLV